MLRQKNERKTQQVDLTSTVIWAARYRQAGKVKLK